MIEYLICRYHKDDTLASLHVQQYSDINLVKIIFWRWPQRWHHQDIWSMLISLGLLRRVNALNIIIIINIPSGVFALVHGCYISMSLACPACFMPWLATSHLPLWSMWSFAMKLLWRRAQKIGQDDTKVHFPAWHGGFCHKKDQNNAPGH